MSKEIKAKLEEALQEIHKVQARVEELQQMVSAGGERTIHVVKTSGRRKFPPQDVAKILLDAQQARELGRGALQIVCKKWGIRTSHLHYFERRAQQQAHVPQQLQPQ
jgi:hypothetical protein